MKWTTHSIFGATLTAWVLFFFQMGVMPLVILLGALGAIFPDIDHPNSKVSNANIFMKIFSVFSIIFITIFNFVFNFLGKLISSVTPWKVKNLTSVHRSPITHSLLTVGLFALVILPLKFALPVWWYWALVLGVLSHVLIDSINPSGTPLLWPIVQGRIRFIPEAIAPTTGTMGEGIVTLVVGVLLGIAILLNWNLYKVNFSDFQQFGGEFFTGMNFGASSPAAKPAYDLSKMDLNTLPAGTVRLPNGEVVLPNGKLLTSLTSVEMKNEGIAPTSLAGTGFTPKDLQKKTGDFIESSGIADFFRSLKVGATTNAPSTISIPGTKPKP